MCHHIDDRRWEVHTADERYDTDDVEDSEEPEEPAFLVDDPAEEVDLLTDGGDEE
jgi:hypothetical protein